MKRSPFALAAAVRDALAAQTAPVLPVGATARIVVALSGGPDSTALLLALHQAVPDLLVGAAHFHHGLRGADADADAGFCAKLCAGRGVPLAIALGKVVPAGQSPQAAARADRYAFLAETCRDWGTNCLAVAHTADDQAETVLGRVLRGTSVDGLAGIPATRELGDGLFVVRPLLSVSRAAIETYCAENGVVPRQDPSNAGTKYTRSRLRQAMPEIARQFNPRLGDALRRLAENARVDADFFAAPVRDLWQSAVVTHRSGETVSVAVAALAGAHPAVSRRVLLQAIRALYPETMPVAREEAATTAFVDALQALIATGTGAVNLPGNAHARLTKKRTELTLTCP